MDGEFGLLDQFDNGRKAALVRNRQRNVNPKPELRQTNNVGEVQILKSVVVGDIQEYRLDALCTPHAIFCRQLAAISSTLLSAPSCHRRELLSAG